MEINNIWSHLILLHYLFIYFTLKVPTIHNIYFDNSSIYTYIEINLCSFGACVETFWYLRMLGTDFI